MTKNTAGQYASPRRHRPLPEPHGPKADRYSFPRVSSSSACGRHDWVVKTLKARRGNPARSCTSLFLRCILPLPSVLFAFCMFSRSADQVSYMITRRRDDHCTSTLYSMIPSAGGVVGGLRRTRRLAYASSPYEPHDKPLQSSTEKGSARIPYDTRHRHGSVCPVVPGLHGTVNGYIGLFLISRVCIPQARSLGPTPLHCRTLCDTLSHKPQPSTS